MMDNLCELESANPGLKVSYWEYASATHTFILENPTHGEVIITIEDTAPQDKLTKPLNKNFPGVYIRSKEVSDKAKQNFFSSWEQGTGINTKKGGKITESLKTRLYSRIFEKK